MRRALVTLRGRLLFVAMSAVLWAPPRVAFAADTRGSPVADSLDWEVSPRARFTVRAAVAGRWAVDPVDIVLDWGPAGPGARPGADARVTLSGTGAGGYFVAEFAAPASTGVIRRRVRAGRMAERTVAARRLERGDVLVPGDLARSSERVWGPPAEDGVAVEPGWVVRRVVEAGAVVAPPAVSPPLLVESGDPVEIRWSRGTVSIRLMGRAQGSGVAGATVYVRTNSGRRMKAVVESRRVVVLDAGGDR